MTNSTTQQTENLSAPDFLTSLRGFLSLWPNMTKEEMKAVPGVLREHYDVLRVSTSGPCLNCGEEIEYEGTCRLHKGQGDAWLTALALKWKTFPALNVSGIEQGGAKFLVNGYAISTVFPYLCAECWNIGVLSAADTAAKESDAASVISAAASRLRNDRILDGTFFASPSKRFRTLQYRVNVNDSEVLCKMPYKEFLQTDYWHIVRNYVIYKRGARCELCNSGDSLNVHHRTYENHGEEHCHLYTLVVLCQPCHAKFHDKLAKVSEVAK